jgi:hypothetical protein
MDFLYSQLHRTFAKKRFANEEPYPITSHEMIANAAVMEAVFKSAWSGNADLAPM